MSEIERVQPPEAMTRQEYAKLPLEAVKRLRRAWGARATPRATTPNGAPFPLRSWPPDAAVDIQLLAEWADPLVNQVVRVYPTAAARNNAITSPTEGMTTWITDIHQQQTYMAGMWAATGGITPAAAAGRTASMIVGAGWQALNLAADPGAWAQGGWTPPTGTGITIPADGPAYRIHITAVLVVAQGGVTVTLGLGTTGALATYGTTHGSTFATGYQQISAILTATPGGTYCPWINASTGIDVSNIAVRVDVVAAG